MSLLKKFGYEYKLYKALCDRVLVLMELLVRRTLCKEPHWIVFQVNELYSFRDPRRTRPGIRISQYEEHCIASQSKTEVRVLLISIQNLHFSVETFLAVK